MEERGNAMIVQYVIFIPKGRIAYERYKDAIINNRFSMAMEDSFICWLFVNRCVK
jgi:hypothetical protein